MSQVIAKPIAVSRELSFDYGDVEEYMSHTDPEFNSDDCWSEMCERYEISNNCSFLLYKSSTNDTPMLDKILKEFAEGADSITMYVSW